MDCIGSDACASLTPELENPLATADFGGTAAPIACGGPGKNGNFKGVSVVRGD